MLKPGPPAQAAIVDERALGLNQSIVDVTQPRVVV